MGRGWGGKERNFLSSPPPPPLSFFGARFISRGSKFLSRVRSLSAGSFSRTAAGNRDYLSLVVRKSYRPKAHASGSVKIVSDLSVIYRKQGRNANFVFVTIKVRDTLLKLHHILEGQK